MGSLTSRPGGQRVLFLVCPRRDQMVRWWSNQETPGGSPRPARSSFTRLSRTRQRLPEMLDQFEHRTWSAQQRVYQIGSGGLGYTHESPPGYDPAHIRAKDFWGNGAAPSFSDVSPRSTGSSHCSRAAMGEPVRPELLRLLRRVAPEDGHHGKNPEPAQSVVPARGSTSTRRWPMWADGTFFPTSPTPPCWRRTPGISTRPNTSLETVLTKAKAHGCVVELIMKDISTLRYQPQRLWECGTAEWRRRWDRTVRFLTVPSRPSHTRTLLVMRAGSYAEGRRDFPDRWHAARSHPWCKHPTAQVPSRAASSRRRTRTRATTSIAHRDHPRTD